LTVKFGTYPSAEIYVRKPLGLVQGLAKIGGFLGFMKLFSLFLSLAHQYMFDKELRMSLYSKGEKSEDLEDPSRIGT
jgi:hypothetical protein